MRIVTVCLLFLLTIPATAQSITAFESPVTQRNGFFGQAVTTGDVTGDGVAEVIISTRESEPSNENATGAGRVYIMNAQGTVLLTLNPPNPEFDGSFGQAVTVAGDADGDGGSDVFVCAPNEDPNGLERAGQLHVFSGSTGALIRTQPSPNPQEESFFCIASTPVDDLDGDGEPDVLIGAASEDGGAGGAGRAYVLSSKTGALIHTLASPNAFITSRFGHKLDDGGDFNNDGVSDLLISASSEPVGVGGAGRVYVFSGSDGAVLQTYEALDPDGEAGFGSSLAAAGDLNSDGTPDVFVGAAIRSGSRGKVHAISGADGTLLYTIVSPSTQADDAFAFGFDNGIAAVEDLNSDGCTDILVSAYTDAELGANAGRVYLLSGADGTLLDIFASSNTGDAGFFGANMASADVTGDGVSDFLIAAPGEQAGARNAGRSYLIMGPTTVAIEDAPNLVPFDLSIAPNPARNATTLHVDLSVSSSLRLSVFDVLGRRVAVLADGVHTAGAHAFRLDASMLPRGLYLVRIATDRAAQTRSLVLSR